VQSAIWSLFLRVIEKKANFVQLNVVLLQQTEQKTKAFIKLKKKKKAHAVGATKA